MFDKENQSAGLQHPSHRVQRRARVRDRAQGPGHDDGIENRVTGVLTVFIEASPKCDTVYDRLIRLRLIVHRVKRIK